MSEASRQCSCETAVLFMPSTGPLHSRLDGPAALRSTKKTWAPPVVVAIVTAKTQSPREHIGALASVRADPTGPAGPCRRRRKTANAWQGSKSSQGAGRGGAARGGHSQGQGGAPPSRTRRGGCCGLHPYFSSLTTSAVSTVSKCISRPLRRAGRQSLASSGALSLPAAPSDP